MSFLRVKRRLPVLSSLALAILIVALAAAYSYRDHAAFSEYAKQTTVREGKALLSSMHRWLEWSRARNMNLEMLTNAVGRACRGSSAQIYSFVTPDMEIFDAGLEPLPTAYLAEISEKSFPTNGFKYLNFVTGDGHYMLFLAPVFPNYIARVLQDGQAAGLNVRARGSSLSLDNNFYFDGDKTADDSLSLRYWNEQLAQRRRDVRQFCRILSGRSCQLELAKMEGDDLPMVIIGIPTSTYLAYLTPRRTHALISLAFFSVATFCLIFFVTMVRERRSAERSLAEARQENEKLQGEKIFNDRLVTIGRAAAAIAHDLRNPLSSIRGFIELFAKHAKEIGDKVYAEHTDVMLREIDRLNSRITGILNFAKPENIDLKPREIGEVLQQLKMLEDSEAAARGVDLVIDLGKNLRPVMLDEAVFMRAALNLCVNAFDAMPYGGELRILARDGGEELILTFIDNGQGIAPELLDRLFAPFVTSKAEGSGLGLASVDKAITAHKGTITARNVAGGGAAFEIHLPYVREKK